MKKYLFTPGPAPVPPEVLLEMARPIIHHRTPEFSSALDQARDRLKPLYGTSSEVILLASTGTGAMEAAVINLLQPGDHAIYVNGGKFGERWGKLLAAFGMIGHEVRVEWGRAARPGQIEDAFKAYPESRAVLVQASETSTCAVHPVAAIGEVSRKRGAMLIVDGITSVGVFEQKMDEWGVDAFVTGSQKALMLPPGLGMIALSARAIDVAKTVKTPRFYFDLLKELKAQRDEHTTAWTAAVSLIFGLNKSLELIHAEGLPQVYARHALMAEATRDAAAALGLKLSVARQPRARRHWYFGPRRSRRRQAGQVPARQPRRVGAGRPGSDEGQARAHRAHGLPESVRHTYRGQRARDGTQTDRRKHSTWRRRRRCAGTPGTEHLKSQWRKLSASF